MTEGEGKPCQMCGTPLAPGVAFCGACGARPGAAEPYEKTIVLDSPSGPAGTVPMPKVGPSSSPAPADPITSAPPSASPALPARVSPAPSSYSPAPLAPVSPAASSPAPAVAPAPLPAPVPASAAGGGIPKTTMLGLAGGMPPVIPPESPLPPKLAEDPNRSTSTGLSGPRAGNIGRTMLGIPAAGIPGQSPQRGTLSPSGKLEPKMPARTMFGMPAADALPPDPPPPEDRVSKATMITPGSLDSTAARTTHGLPSAAVLASDAARAQISGLSSGDPSITPLPPRHDEDTRRVTSDAPGAPSRGTPVATSRPPAPRSPAGLVLSILGLCGVAAIGAYVFLGRAQGPEVNVRIDAESGSERMVFEVAGAQPGAKLRFGGIEQPIEGGRATFPLGAGSLQVGQNAVLFDVLETDGDAHPGKVMLSLDYRVTVDTSPLHTGKGAIDVVVSALPGSRAWIGGEELKLDAQGRAARRETLEANALRDAKVIEHVASYRVQPPGQEPQVGQITTKVPITALAIDRPGLQIVTDADSIEIAGSVDADATVTVAGEPIAVQEGRFLHRFALPNAGKHTPEVIARSTGKAPRAVVLEIERVEDLAAAARGFAADASLSYAKIAQNPAIYAGQKAAYEGRIYNVSVDAGRSVLQMLVRECPAGVRCPLWVEYGAATELTVDKWVRAVGTISGAQQFRAENDAVQTVPKLDAFVLVPIEN
jgi:hypothetical protein